MRSEYKEWAAQYNESQPISFYNGAIAAWEHQQSKVDELQKRVDASLIAFENLKEEINQLHGQCDLHLIKYLEEKSQVLEQALKGGSDE